jgi:ABC-type multidrug transport system permease subunit
MFLKAKVSYIWLVIMPLAFIYFTGMAFKGPGDPANPRPSARLDNLDTNFLGRVLLDKLDARGMNVLTDDSETEAERGIRIPADFTERALKKEPVKIEFFKTGTSADQSAAMIELRVFRAVLSLNSDLVQLASSGGDRAINEVELVKLQAQPRPVTLDTSFAGRNPIPSGFNHSLPANMVMFLMINLLVFGGASVSTERESGVIRRLAVYPIARGQLILGKVYGRFLLGVFQITVFLLAGAFLFDVPVGNSPLALVVGLCLFAWVAASLGVLIGSLITGEEKTIGVCVVSSLVMGAMGGCWWPMEIVPETMQKVAHLVPAAWAMDLLHQVISFGGGFGDVLPEIFALLGFAVGFNLLAARFFRV